MDVKKDIYVEMKLTAVKNGAVWNDTTVTFPNQSKDTYHVMELILMEAFKQMEAAAKSGQGK